MNASTPENSATPAPVSRTRAALRVGAWALGAVLLLFTSLAGALLVAGNTAGGRALIEHLTDRLTSGHVRIFGLAGSFPAALELDALELRDDRGVWLSARQLSLRWSPLALALRHVDVASLRIARLDIERRPATTPSSRSLSAGPSLPHIDVRQLTIDALTLGPELTGVSATLSAAGKVHLVSFEDATAVLRGRREGSDGSYSLDLALTPARIDASLELAEPASGPLENLLGLPGLGALSAHASLRGPRTALQLAVALDVGGLHGGAKGNVDLADSTGDLDYALEAPAMRPRPDLAWERLSLQGHWRGSVRAPTAEGQLQIDALRLGDATRLAAVRADLTASGGTIGLRGDLLGLTIPGPRPALLAASPVRLEASLRLDQTGRPLELRTTHPLFALQLHAVTADHGDTSFTLRLPEIAPLAAVGGADLQGQAMLTGTVSRQASAGGRRTRLALAADLHLRGGKAVWVAPLLGPARLEVAATVDDRSFELDRLRLTAPSLILSASGRQLRPPSGAPSSTPGQVEARWELALSNLARVSPALSGSLKAEGRVAGPRNALAVDAELSSTLALRGSAPGTLKASVHAVGIPSALRGTLRAQGQLGGSPLALDVALEPASGGAFRARILHADWRSAHIDGDLTSGADLQRAQALLHLQVDQLPDLQPLLGIQLGGSVSGTLRLVPGRGPSQAQLELDARNVGSASWMANARVTGTGSLGAFALKVQAELPALRGEPATLTSEALLDLGARELRLLSARATYRGQVLRLLDPAQVAFQDGLSITRLRLGVQQAVLAFDGRLFPTLDAQASLKGVNPALVDAVLPGLVSAGTLEAEARLEGTVSAPRGTLRLDARDVRPAAALVPGVPAIDLHASADLQGSTAQLEARLGAGASSLVTAVGSVPLAADGGLALKIAGKLDLALANPLLEAHGRHAAGMLSVDASVDGDASEPEITGTLGLTGGELRDYAQGIHLTEVTGQAEGSHGTLRLTSLTARAAPGTITVAGSFGILQPGFPIDLKLTARNARPIASNLVTSDLDADLRLHGTLRDRLDLSGSIRSILTRIEIPDSLPPDVAVLDVRRPGQDRLPPPPHKLVIGLDLAIRAPQQVRVNGRGLSAELGGEIDISGTRDEPLITGGFDLIRGTFSLASSQLNFNTGQVSFAGAGLRNQIDPTLDFTAQTVVLDVTVMLKITGVADAPVFSLTSTPELPQDEILARLLFGETASQLTTLQLAQIGVALTTLSGSGTGLNPLVRIQKSLGLDRLAVGGGTATTGNTTNSGATLEAGRYVSKRVYVGAKQSTTGASQIQVQVDLTKHLKLQSQLGNGTAPVQGTTPENDPGSSVGISYQFEY
jgi:translocation and assembly module TamB